MKVHLITNPIDDTAFRADAERLLAQGAHSPAELERNLREQYSIATVFRGIEEAGTERWYVYREGRWVASSGTELTAR